MESLQEELDNTLAEVDTMLAEWEEEQVVAEEAEQADELTRWSLEVSNSNSLVVVDQYHSPSRIEESDIYDIRLTLYNNMTNSDGDLIALNDLYLDLTFTPQSSSAVYINEKNTWLDTVKSPYIFWEMDVVTRGDDKYTRRISFTSERITVPKGEWLDEANHELGVKPTMELQLEFNLEYVQ